MSFDTLAPYYRWLEFFLAGQTMHRSRTAFLNQMSGAQNILLLGEGHGRALVECRRLFPTAQITCVDASHQMLEQARRNLLRHHQTCDRVEFIHADALSWTPPANTFDLLVTQFFFDCFEKEQIAGLVHQLASALTASSKWLIADFQIPATGVRRLRSRLIVWFLYRFFRVATRLPARRLTAPDEFLIAAGFKLQNRLETDWGLLRSDSWCKR